ncbi:MAG: amidohydrolase family protein [Gammaproteobacteria bacterium]
MAYTPSDRDYYDADSHVMELPNFIIDYADKEFKDLIPPVNYKASLVTDEEVEAIVNNGGKHTKEHVQAQINLGDRLISESKEIQALGAFDREDRSVAMDLLGFKKQLVFATHSVVTPFRDVRGKAKYVEKQGTRITPELRYGATRAHNRAMADFCSQDSRLMGVGVIPLHEPELAMIELDFAIKSDLEAIWIPHYAAGEKSPGHLSLDPFWQKLSEEGIPFLMHVGGSPLQLDKSWSNNGKPPSKDWMGGGENVRAKDMVVMHQGPEIFVSMMVLDGVFERHPKLKGASVELGAAWVPEMISRLDYVAKTWSRVDKSLREIKRKPSEQLIEQMAFTPFPHENVSALIEASDPELYLFSSDYPHVEGTRDPIGKFEKSLANQGEINKNLFYSENFLRIFPEARVK